MFDWARRLLSRFGDRVRQVAPDWADSIQMAPDVPEAPKAKPADKPVTKRPRPKRDMSWYVPEPPPHRTVHAVDTKRDRSLHSRIGGVANTQVQFASSGFATDRVNRAVLDKPAAASAGSSNDVKPPKDKDGR